MCYFPLRRGIYHYWRYLYVFHGHEQMEATLGMVKQTTLGVPSCSEHSVLVQITKLVVGCV